MQPQNPDPQFDFMLKNNAQPKGKLSLPNMPKPVKIILALVAAAFILIVAFSLLSGRGKGAAQPIIGVMARGQETLRVTQQVQQLRLQDPSTQALAATVYGSISSDEQQLKTYLTSSHTKVSVAQLAADTDKSTDAQMQSASQNNSLDQTYENYLKESLAKYQAGLQAAYKAAGPKGQAILKNALDSTQTLLSNPPLKT